MFRPCFGNSGVFADEMEGKVLDRALQLDLDRQAQPKVAASLPALAGASGSIDVQFMPAEELAQWRDWVVEFVGRGFSWDRLNFMARRAAAGGDPQPFLKIADAFLDGLPGSIEELYRLIGPGRVARFKAGAIEKARHGWRSTCLEDRQRAGGSRKETHPESRPASGHPPAACGAEDRRGVRRGHDSGGGGRGDTAPRPRRG